MHPHLYTYQFSKTPKQSKEERKGFSKEASGTIGCAFRRENCEILLIENENTRFQDLWDGTKQALTGNNITEPDVSVRIKCNNTWAGLRPWELSGRRAAGGALGGKTGPRTRGQESPKETGGRSREAGGGYETQGNLHSGLSWAISG